MVNWVKDQGGEIRLFNIESGGVEVQVHLPFVHPSAREEVIRGLKAEIKKYPPKERLEPSLRAIEELERMGLGSLKNYLELDYTPSEHSE